MDNEIASSLTLLAKTTPCHCERSEAISRRMLKFRRLTMESTDQGDYWAIDIAVANDLSLIVYLLLRRRFYLSNVVMTGT